MKMYLILAWRNIWRNKRRSLITIGSITFAVLLACFMRSMQLGSYERMIDSAARFYTGFIQVHANGYWKDKTLDNSFEFDPLLVDSVTKTKGVEAVVPRLESFALASFHQKTKGSLILGIDPDKEDALTRVREKVTQGEYLASDDQAVMVSEGLAEYLHLSVGDSLVLISQGYHGANAAGVYFVKGIMKFPSPAQNNGTIYLPLQEAQWFFAAPAMLTSLSLVVDKASHVDGIVQTLNTAIDTTAYEVMGWQTLMPDLVQSIEIDSISGQIMVWILYAVIGFGMFGTFLMMTAERMYEFGVMMSIGMKRRTMQFTIFLEMALMSTIGVIAGICITLPFLTYYYHNPIYFTGESAEAIEKFGVEAAYFFSLDPAIFYNQAWAIFIMAFILGLYPLFVIQKLKPVKAMREA